MGVAFAGLSRRPKVARREKRFAGTLTSALCFWPGGGLVEEATVPLFAPKRSICRQRRQFPFERRRHRLLLPRPRRPNPPQEPSADERPHPSRVLGLMRQRHSLHGPNASEGAPTQGSSAQADSNISQEEATWSERSLTTTIGQDSSLETAFRTSTKYSAHPSSVARTGTVWPPLKGVTLSPLP